MADVAPDPASVLLDGPWLHRDVSANGTRLHVAELGQGPLVMLLHGFPQFWWAWRHQLVALANAGYRVVAPDLRGYGASDKPPRGYDAFTLADDVAGLIRALGERDAVLVGHDWGGLACWTAAAVWPRQVSRIAVLGMPHPLRVRHQYAVSPRGQGLAGAHLFSFQLPWRPERQLVADDAAKIGEYLRSWGGPDYPSADEEARYRSAMRIPGVAHSSLEYHRWVFRSLFRPDGARFAQALRRGVLCPVLHLHGGADQFLLPDTAQGSGRYVSGPYTWQLVPEAGHFLPEEAPDLVTALLLQWLGTPDPVPATG